MNSRFKGYRLAMLGAAWCSASVPAYAQDVQRASVENPNEVLARARPGYEPTGIRTGGFLILPAAEIDALYDDNVYASDRFKRADASVLGTVSAEARSTWSRNSFILRASGAAERFAKQKQQNNETASLSANGTLDVTRRVAVDANARIARLVEPRGSQGDAFVGGSAPAYGLKEGGAALRLSPGRLGVLVQGGLQDFTYYDIRLNGVDVDQSYRNRQEANLTGRLSYTFSPNLSGFVTGSRGSVSYDNRRSGFDLDSKGTTVLGGVDFTISRLLIGALGVGYIRQTFDDPRFRSVSGLAYDGRLVWNPRTLVSVTLAGRSTVQQSGIVGVGGVLVRDVSLSADYELLRNLLLRADVGATSRRFRGIDREDSLATVGVGARYLLGRNLDFDLSYRHTGQGSSGIEARDFASNRLMLGIRLKR